MPSNAVATSQAITPYRRPTASSKHRENNPQASLAGPSRRRRSRSPDARMADDTISTRASETGALRRKKKSSSALSSHTGNARPMRDSVASDDVSSVGKMKSRHRPHSQVSEEPEVQILQDTRQSSKSKRRESSRSRELSRRAPSKAAVSEGSGDEGGDMDTTMYSQSDFVRLKKELEDIKKHMHQTEKKARKQDKELDRLRKELSTSQKATSEQASQLTKLKSQSKKSDELITTIENHMSCHICMDILARPYGLSPCGHVLCMGCLQEWFRTAAPNEEDMDDDNMPDALVYRKKICPVCRTVVRSRPIPLFVVKSIAGALEKHKANSAAARRASPLPEADPWAGIFLDYTAEEADEDVDEEEDDYDGHWTSDDDGYGDGYGSVYDDSEEEDAYQGEYVHARWEPPNGRIATQDYAFLDDVEDDELPLLRRGCTLQMINLFQMTYNHSTGLQALVDGHNLVFLGFNVDLLDHDPTGEEFMDWITRDIHERPERWDRQDNIDGTWSAWKLVRAEDDQDYDTTDSELWFDGQMGEDELDLL
ncbi:hypothetical protein BXZ70DRAFT_679542 [Cristinia sonorae]|uniref:RING-type domain-containing protein n=1 Tax=Cristinia sonorae TaxID=1940300 RepID=A0A8K0UUU4_9AGAR|nr:hypothetical protein BXZ70DRAFT_679542 [Cristinia sonorae]